MTWLYTVRPTRLAMVTAPTEQESAVIGRHFAYLQRLTEAGIASFVGRTLDTDERCFGIVVFEAASESEARHIMEDDPAVQDGLMRAELHPFRTVLVGRNPNV